MLQFKNVTAIKKQFSLNNISFCAEKGFITAIVGSNGSGKTTLLSLITDQNSKYEGEILFNGVNIRNNHDKFRSLIGIVCDENHFFSGYSIAENIRLISPFYPDWNNEMFKETMRTMKISSAKKISDLSRGEYIRFQFAFAMAHNARLYIFDEATAGMDPVFRKDFFKMLHGLIAAQPEIIAIMTTHIEEDIRKHVDYLGILDNGSLISFAEVM